MDAAALLKSQGWRGKGFSLHPDDNSVGLATPLLLSRNRDGRGVGSKPHYTSDQWWLSAFDEKLKGLDISKKGQVVQSVTKGKLDLVAASTAQGKYSGASGLYASFVRGGLLQGTLDVDATVEESTTATPPSEERDSVAGFGNGAKNGMKKETKEERRARGEVRRARKLEKVARKAAMTETARKAVEKAKRKKAKQMQRDGETKEERRARRAERRARKEAKRKKRIESARRQTAS